MPRLTNARATPAAMLRHPLVVGGLVALLSGVVASLLIPAVTRSWQDRPRELALKRDLVKRVSKTSADASARANAFGFTTETAKQRQVKVTRAQRIAFLAATLRRWEVGASAIGSELETYFSDTSIPKQWHDYEGGVTAFLRYISGAEVDLRSYLLGLLRDHFRNVRFDDRADDQTRREVASGTFLAGSKRIEISSLLVVERDQIASRVVNAKAAGFSHGFWIFR